MSGRLRAALRPVVGLLVGVLLAEAGAQAFLAIPAARQRLYAGAWPVIARVEWARGVRHDVGEDQETSRFDPRLGWRLSPGRTLGMTHAVATLDADGVRRNAPPAPEARPVVLLGDSFTFGWDVGDDDTFAARLAVLRPDLAPEDRGVPGYGLDQAWLAWQALPPGRHAVVVLGLNRLLVERTVEPFHVYVRPNVAAERGDFEPEPVTPPEALRWRVHATPALVTLLRAAAWARFTGSGAAGRLAAVRADALLRRLADDVAAAGDQLVVLLLPAGPEGDAAALRQDAAGLRARVAPVCDRPEVICVDPGEGLAAVAAEGRLYVDGHYAPAGHEVLARALAGALPRR
jgi:hypothetical protein